MKFIFINCSNSLSNYIAPAGAIVGVILGWLLSAIHLDRLLFKPKLEFEIVLVPTRDAGENDLKYFNLSVTNKGVSANNVCVKIREKNCVEWLNLLRPFSELRQENEKLCIRKLAKYETEHFSIFGINASIGFISSNIKPYNQKMILEKGGEYYYSLEIVQDCYRSKKIEIVINFSSYDDCVCSIVR